MTPIEVIKRTHGKGTPAATQILKGLSNDVVDSLVELYENGSDIRTLVIQEYAKPKPRKEKAPTLEQE